MGDGRRRVSQLTHKMFDSDKKSADPTTRQVVSADRRIFLSGQQVDDEWTTNGQQVDNDDHWPVEWSDHEFFGGRWQGVGVGVVLFTTRTNQQHRLTLSLHHHFCTVNHEHGRVLLEDEKYGRAIAVCCCCLLLARFVVALLVWASGHLVRTSGADAWPPENKSSQLVLLTGRK